MGRVYPVERGLEPSNTAGQQSRHRQGRGSDGLAASTPGERCEDGGSGAKYEQFGLLEAVAMGNNAIRKELEVDTLCFSSRVF